MVSGVKQVSFPKVRKSSERPRWQQFLIYSSCFFFIYLINGFCNVYISSKALGLLIFFKILGENWSEKEFSRQPLGGKMTITPNLTYTNWL